MKRLLCTRKRMLLGVLLLAILAAVAAVSLSLASEGSATVDEAAIAEPITEFNRVMADTLVVPQEALSAVESHQAALRDDEEWQPTEVSGGSCPRVLPENAWEAMDSEFVAALAECCSKEYADSLASHFEPARQLNETLYNNPSEPAVVEEQTKVMAVEIMDLKADKCTAWAYVWYGDVTTAGNGPQAWIVWEYYLVNEDGNWVVDGRMDLGSLSAARDANDELVSTEWGPASPQESVKSMFGPRTSKLFVDRELQLRELDDLQKQALAKD